MSNDGKSVADRAEWAAATTINLMGTAPRDGTPVLGRNAEGHLALIRWMTEEDWLEQADWPRGLAGWFTFADNELFTPVSWIPTKRSRKEIAEKYD
jgi:hypothetical protein